MVNGNISDLFFNYDVSEAELHDGSGNYIGHDETLLTAKAQEVLDMLEALGVDVPTADELVEDFYNRM